MEPKHRHKGRNVRRPPYHRLVSMASIALCALGYTAPVLALDFKVTVVRAQALMKTGNFKSAAETIRMALYQNDQSAQCWLLLGECYERQAERSAALQTYKALLAGFPKSTEAAIASKRIANLLKPLPTATPTLAPPPTSTTGGTTSNAHHKVPDQPKRDTQLAAGLSDRVFVVPPKFDHPAVDQSTVLIVRDVIKKLPSSIYKVLSDGGTKIFVEPNFVDSFPDAVEERHPILGHYLSQELGRTYGTDVHISERRAIHGSTDLEEPASPESIRANVYVLLSHALNVCLESPSESAQYKQIYKQDVAAMDGDLHERLRGFVVDEKMGQTESFAALAGSLMGGRADHDRDVNRAFPRCRAWIESRIETLAARGRRHSSKPQ